jgi:hypothetical protein
VAGCGWGMWLRYLSEMFEDFMFPCVVVRMPLGLAHTEWHLRSLEREAMFLSINIHAISYQIEGDSKSLSLFPWAINRNPAVI